MINKIAVIGAGYVGFANSLALAALNEVTLFEINEVKINLINNNRPPIEDAEAKVFMENEKFNLHCIKYDNNDFSNFKYIILSLPTNYDENLNYFDTSHLDDVIENLSEKDFPGKIIIKSTVPLGYTKNKSNEYKNLDFIFCPEFLQEGSAFRDTLFPNRVIVGSNREDNKKDVEVAKLFLDAAVNKPKVIYCSSSEAESIKLFANTYLALRVAFFNELDNFALKNNLDTQTIIDCISLDPRIGEGYNNPSFGYGGYCLPKDTKQLLANYRDTPQNLIKAIIDSNSTRKDFIANEIISKNPNIVGVFKLAMKVGSDNTRESAIQGIIRRLQKHNIEIIIYEPIIEKDEFYGSKLVSDLNEFKSKSSIILTNRMSPELDSVKEKVFTRDIYRNN